MNANDDIKVRSITGRGVHAKSTQAFSSLPSPNQNLNRFNNLDSSSQTLPNGVTAPEDIPIAIVGMAMRLPGGISNEEELWDTLIKKKDKRTLVPADRWNVDGFYSETPKRGSVKTKHGYFLDGEALRQFDASLFSITRAELEKVDPQHRLLLEVTRECLENAGEINWRGKNIGCYVGVFGEDWLAVHAQGFQRSKYNRKDRVFRLLKKCTQYFRGGAIEPIRPTKVFDAIQIEEAFRFMQKSQHIGKIVVSMPADSLQLTTSNTHSQFSLRPDVSYLLVGGLGGLGQSVSTWMVKNGARHLVYLSRGGGKKEEEVAFVTVLSAQGCTIQTISGSVANMVNVERVISEAQFPISGVIQMSMVLKDGGYAQMTHRDWEFVQAPKVLSTWNLHKAFESVPLEIFALFSSVSCQWGQWGLPASVIDVGVLEDVGYLSENPAILQQFKTNGVQTLRENDLLETLELAIMKSKATSQAFSFFADGYASESYIGCGYKMSMAVHADNNRNVWKCDIRMSVYRNLHNSTIDDSAASHEGLKDFLATVSNNPQTLKASSAAEFLAEEIGKTLCSFMMRPIAELDIHQSFKTLGVDSLVAVELRNWCRQKIGVGLTVLDIMGAASIKSLGMMAAGGLLDKRAI
ncbi:uncharacterized protein EAF01_010629 [Botrytis porri]|uniref:Carrier domain-containing protein n=1 Tax=Botrytis porri TaxID=87229 RepID=A0A4Z1KUV7_9HELO|nr:uncharacterized protein EAF01_010629 [Botrytis porri]KAF7890820.1 hypothetical protein EAF01_010629 [Botrytis porri]TGO88312.1 hypothetical protein BPOR_0170g00040 [Botrytis porri]